MEKKLIFVCSLMISSIAYSQVGINTENPQTTLHVDGAKDNPATGAPSVAQQANDFAVTSTGRVGIGITAPTNTLDVNGTARIRTVNQAPAGSTTTPLYMDSTGVVMLSSGGSANYGEIRSITSSIAAGVNSLMLSGIPDGAYTLTVLVGNSCSNFTSAEYWVHNYSPNGLYGLKGQNGFATHAFNTPTFTQTVKDSIAVTWASVAGCADGGNATQFNYTVTMPFAGQINIINNGNVTRTYKLILKRLQ